MSYGYKNRNYDDYRNYKNKYSDDGGCDNSDDFHSQSNHPESIYNDYEPTPLESDHGESIYNEYGNYEEINEDHHHDMYDNSGCASQSDDADWDHPSALDYHYHDHDHNLTLFDLDHHNQDPPPSRHHHDNPTCPEMNCKFTYSLGTKEMEMTMW